MNAIQMFSADNVATWVCLKYTANCCVNFSHESKVLILSLMYCKNQEIFIASEQVLKDQPSPARVSSKDIGVWKSLLNWEVNYFFHYVFKIHSGPLGSGKFASFKKINHSDYIFCLYYLLKHSFMKYSAIKNPSKYK